MNTQCLVTGRSWLAARAGLRLKIVAVTSTEVILSLGAGTTAKRTVSHEEATKIISNFLSRYKSAKEE